MLALQELLLEQSYLRSCLNWLGLRYFALGKLGDKVVDDRLGIRRISNDLLNQTLSDAWILKFYLLDYNINIYRVCKYVLQSGDCLSI